MTTHAGPDADAPPEPPAGLPGTAERSVQRWAASAVRIVLWVFLNLTLLLTTWVGIGWAIGGWSPVVITSGSMEPALGVGDVLFIDDRPD